MVKGGDMMTGSLPYDRGVDYLGVNDEYEGVFPMESYGPSPGLAGIEDFIAPIKSVLGGQFGKLLILSVAAYAGYKLWTKGRVELPW